MCAAPSHWTLHEYAGSSSPYCLGCARLGGGGLARAVHRGDMNTAEPWRGPGRACARGSPLPAALQRGLVVQSAHLPRQVGWAGAGAGAGQYPRARRQIVVARLAAPGDMGPWDWEGPMRAGSAHECAARTVRGRGGGLNIRPRTCTHTGVLAANLRLPNLLAVRAA